MPMSTKSRLKYDGLAVDMEISFTFLNQISKATPNLHRDFIKG
jgi:hypothetical protein